MQRDTPADVPPPGVNPPPPVPRVRRMAVGAVLGGTGFAAASVAGVAGAHLLGQTAGLQARADDAPRIWLANGGGGTESHDSRRGRLACSDIDLWGNDIEHATGTYTVVSEEPGGHDQKVLTGTWRYAPKKEGRQVLAVLPGPALVGAAQAAVATPRGAKGLRFAVKLKHAHSDDERRFWVAACPAAPAPAPAAAVSAAHATRRATVPSTGGGDGTLPGLLLVTAGGTCLGAAAGARRDRRSGAAPRGAAPAVTATRPWCARAAVVAAGSVRACRGGLATTLTDRRLAVAVVAVAAAGVVAGPGRDATVGAVRHLVTRTEQLLVPQSAPARVIPVDVDPGTSSPADPELTGLGYPFPAGARRAR